MTKKGDSQFHFSTNLPPEEFFLTIQAINKLTVQQYGEVFNRVFALLHNPDIAYESESTLHSYSDDSNLDHETAKNILKVLLIISSEARKNKLTSGQLFSDLQKLKLDVTRASSFCQMWKQSVLSKKKTVSEVETTHLRDFQWKFGVTASNSELRRVGNCHIQIKMAVYKGSKTENVWLELSVPQFYEFMHEMEKAKMELDSID